MGSLTVRLPELDPQIEANIAATAAALQRYDTLAVACHVGPDGDALGSMLGLALALQGTGKDVTCGWGSPTVDAPAQYRFLPGLDLLRPPDGFGDEIELFVAVDCATIDRLELLVPRFEQATTRVNIDHHVSSTSFGTLNLVDPSAPSSSELVLRVLERMGITIDDRVATCLYSGLVTDTGRFQYANVTPRAHVAAGYLIDCGVKVDAVSQAVFESLPFGYLKTLGLVLGRCELLEDPPLCLTYLSQEDLRSGGISLDETEGLIDVVRSTRESDVAAIFKQLDNGKWKASLRSKGATDVGSIAQQFGGGGHTLAAGYTSELGLQESIKALRSSMRSARRSPSR